MLQQLRTRCTVPRTLLLLLIELNLLLVHTMQELTKQCLCALRCLLLIACPATLFHSGVTCLSVMMCSSVLCKPSLANFRVS